MIDSKVSVRRYIKAMFAATARSECLGLLLVAARPADLDLAPGGDGTGGMSAVLGPYLGMARPVPAGYESAGVVLPEGTRVLADGLDAHCWPGSEAAFREELTAPSPESWDRDPHGRRGGTPDVAERAAAEIAWYIGATSRAVPAIAVLDPTTRRAVVISLPRGTSMWTFGRRLVEEMGSWPHRRLAVVEDLVTARMDQALLEHPDDPEVARLQVGATDGNGRADTWARAVRAARCIDALRTLGPAAPGVDGVELGRGGRLRDTITQLRDELERCDRLVPTADAAARAARAELGELRATTIDPPEALADWHFDHLRVPGALRRMIRG